VASVQAHGVVEGSLALWLLLITGIGKPSVGLKENSWTKVLLGVPPVRWARCRAASAENALVKTVELLTVFLALAVLASVWSWGIALEVWLNGLVLLVELGQIWYDVLDNVGVGKWVDLGFLLGIGWDTAQASQSVDTIDVHGTTSADTLTARSSEGKSWVDLVLNANEGVQHHGSGLVQVEGVGLHAWLGGRLIGVPSVDVEGLDLGRWLSSWFLDGRGLGFWNWLDGRGDRVIGSDLIASRVSNGGERAGSNWGPEGRSRGREEARGGTKCCHCESL